MFALVHRSRVFESLFMKISKLFHWLYASAMFLPLLVIPIFAINIINRSPEPISVEVSQGKNVEFNQKKASGGQHTYIDNGITTIIDDYTYSMSGTCDNTFIFNFGTFSITPSHIFYLRYEIKSVLGQFRIGDFNNGTSISYTDIGAIYEPVTGPYLGVEILEGVTVDIQFYFNAFDLTQMFGSGNEPTIEQFNNWFPNDYYDFDSGSNYYISDYDSIVYNDNDIGSQFFYSLYHSVDRYFNFDNIFNFGDLYFWLNSTFFSGSAPLGFFIFWHYLIYWLLISLLWLLFDVLMYVPNLVHRWLDKAAIE